MKGDIDPISPIDISANAMIEIKKIIEHKNIPDSYGLRLGIKGGGCSGVSYLIGFDQKKVTDDEFKIQGVPVYIERKHLMFIMGLKVDFVDEAEERGFIFINEN